MATYTETSSAGVEPTLAERTRSDIAELKGKAGELTDKSIDGLDRATTSVGRGMERAGESVDAATHRAAEGVVRAGRYMQESNPATMAEDFGKLARNHPMATLCVGFGLGWMVSRMVRS